MTIISALLDSGICGASYAWLEDMASVTGGAGYSYALIYATFIILLVLMFAIIRSEIIGLFAGIFGFVLIGIAGGAGCVPLPSMFVNISVIIGLFITLSLFFIFKSLR